jgi:hypothetical protein
MRLRRVQRWSDVEWLRWSLDHLPEHVRQAASPEWWLLRGQRLDFIGAWLPAWSKAPDRYGRDPLITTCYLYHLDAIALHPDDDHGSVPVHEFAHAVDWRFGNISDHLSFRGTPLDEYAAANAHERFAQAFTAWWRGDRWGTDTYLHTAVDVRRQEPDIAAWLMATFGAGA